MTISRRISHYLIAAMLSFNITVLAQSMRSDQTLEGAWNVTVVFQDQGLPFCAPDGTVLTIVNPGNGTVIAESCYASEGTGYGTWVRMANNQFAITSIGNSYGPDATVVAPYKVRASVSLGPTSNSFARPLQNRIFRLGGQLNRDGYRNSQAA
jgi:hypothetical protein